MQFRFLFLMLGSLICSKGLVSVIKHCRNKGFGATSLSENISLRSIDNLSRLSLKELKSYYSANGGKPSDMRYNNELLSFLRWYLCFVKGNQI